MTNSMSKKNEDDLNELADIYSVLKSDAKTIVADLQGGVTMWREAAAGAIASAGFIVILTLFYLQFNTEPIAELRWATLAFFIGMAIVMGFIGVVGFKKYFELRRKYASLFEKAKLL